MSEFLLYWPLFVIGYLLSLAAILGLLYSLYKAVARGCRVRDEHLFALSASIATFMLVALVLLSWVSVVWVAPNAPAGPIYLVLPFVLACFALGLYAFAGMARKAWRT